MIGNSKIWLVLATVVYIVAMQLYGIIKPLDSELGTMIYYKGDALTHFFIGVFVYMNFKRYWIAFIFLGLTLNNLMDELFFNPTKLQLNELIFCGFLLLIGAYRYGNWKQLFRKFFERVN